MTQGDGELRALTTFFGYAAPQYGFYDWKARALREGATEHGLYKKNLEKLRELVEKKHLDLKAFERHCRFLKKEKRQVQWVDEVVPEEFTDASSLDRNLLKDKESHIHRLLVSVTLPVSRLEFGSESSVQEGSIEISYKERFTLDDLIDHFCSSFAVARNKQTEKSLIGAFNYLLGIHPLETILFAMDHAIVAEDYIRTPFSLQDRYIPLATQEISQRKARA